MPLSSTDKKQLHDALFAAFVPDGFARMLDLYAGRRMDLYTSRYKDMPDIVIDVMNGAQREGWLVELLDAARRANPGNEGLAAIASRIGVTPLDVGLERKVRAALPYLDIVSFRTKLTAIESQVCRVESPDGYGTGFLLGPDVLITNHHVLASVIEGRHTPEQVTLRFDYKVLTDGTTLNPGTTFGLATDEWLLDWSPSGEPQGSGYSAPSTAAEPNLDYALVRVAGAPGEQPLNPAVAAAGSGPAPTREWIRLPDPAPTLAVDDPIFIIEHPEAAPLKLAVETKSFLGVFENGTRLRHRTNTDPGSSGSPCFDANWNLVALHRGGDVAATPEWNEAIPFTAILALLQTRGKLALVGSL
jgi:hypothetical protein